MTAGPTGSPVGPNAHCDKVGLEANGSKSTNGCVTSCAAAGIAVLAIEAAAGNSIRAPIANNNENGTRNLTEAASQSAYRVCPRFVSQHQRQPGSESGKQR
ncbi:MAG: hypothetical protein WB676_03505 [Bryobacteraceae bacterium]